LDNKKEAARTLSSSIQPLILLGEYDLWDVHDKSTSSLMREFYKHYIQTGDMPSAVPVFLGALRTRREITRRKGN
jgi:hypothetical protein